MSAVSSNASNEKCKKRWQHRLCAALRELQNKTSCSTRHLRHLLDVLAPFFANDVPRNVDMADFDLQSAAGVQIEELYACSRIDCPNRTVWTYANVPEFCPECQHSLRNKRGDRDTVFYFPVRHRLEALLKTNRFRRLVRFEDERKSNPAYFTDVFDSPGKFRLPDDVRVLSI